MPRSDLCHAHDLEHMLDLSAAELREYLGDQEYEELEARGRQAVNRALAEYRKIRERERFGSPHSD